MPSHENSDLIHAYWREVLPENRTKRTAQDHAKKNHPKWVAWLATQGRKVHDTSAAPTPVTVTAFVKRLHDSPPPAATGDDLPPGPLPAPPAIDKPLAERTPEEHAECEAWSMFSENTAAAKRLAKSDSITAAGFARIACQCLASYHAARQRRIQADIENKRLLPVAEFDALCNDARRVTDLYRSMGPDLATQIDPVNPGRITRLFENYIQDRINPILQRFIGTGSLPALAA